MSSEDYQSMEAQAGDEPGLSTSEATLAIISTMIGVGINAIPYAMSVVGLWRGIAINVAIIGLYLFASYLLWKVRVEMKLDHLSEMLYLTVGRGSIFLLNGLLSFIIYGVIVVYLIIISRICRSLLEQFGIENEFASKKWPWVLGIVAFLSPIFMRRTLGEMRCQNRILFVGIIFMILVMGMLAASGVESTSSIVDSDESLTEQFIDSLNITQGSYGFLLNLYPIVNSMKRSKQNARNVGCAIVSALTFTFVVHVALAVLAIQIYGQEGIEVNLLDNLAKETTIGPLILQLTFLTVFLSNTPFFFLPGKYFLLNIVFEYKERLFSRQLDNNLAQSNGDYEQVTEKTLDSKDVVRNCDSLTYYTTSVAYLAIIVITAIFVDDLTLMFGMLSALGSCLMTFVMPVVILLLGVKSEIGCGMRVGALAFALFGVLFSLTSNTFNAQKLIREFS